MHRDLNTLSDPKGIGLSISGNIVTVPAGTYSMKWRAPGYLCNRFTSRLAYSSTSSTIASGITYVDGTTGYSHILDGVCVEESFGDIASITFTDTTYLKIEQYSYDGCKNPSTGAYLSTGLGTKSWIQDDGNGNSVDSVYTTLQIEDLSTAVKNAGDDYVSGTAKVAILKDQKGNQVNGGTFNSSGWRDRDLTVEEDPQTFVDFTATPNGQTTEGNGTTPGYWSLPAGQYKIEWTAPAFDANRHKTRLVYSTTQSQISTAGLDASASFVEGSTENTSDNDGSIATISTGHTVINLPQTTWFKIMHYCSNDKATIGFGRRQSSNTNADTGNNIYTQVRIEDLKTAVKDVVTNAITKVAKVEEIGAYGTSGAGSFTASTWITRSLTNVTDPKNIGITLNTTDNYITVPAGTYSIKWSAPALNCTRHVSRLLYSTSSTFSFNSAATTDVYAPVAYTFSNNSETQSRSTGFLPTVTFTGTTYIKVEHYSDVGASNGDGLGVSSPWSSAVANASSPPIWTTIEIEDLATAVKEPTGTDIPVGGIIMYHGTETELNALTNWKLCNGLNGTPNLADKFVICGNNWETHSGTDKWVTRVETGSAPGTETGGSKNAVLPAHSHTDPTYNGLGGSFEAPRQSGGVDYGQGAQTLKTAIDANGTITTGASATQTGTNANLPPYFALAYIMRIS